MPKIRDSTENINKKCGGYFLFCQAFMLPDYFYAECRSKRELRPTLWVLGCDRLNDFIQQITGEEHQKTAAGCDEAFIDPVAEQSPTLADGS